MANGLATSADAEERYVEVASADKKILESIATQAAQHRRQAASYAEVRDGYTKEASLLDAGRLAPDAEKQLIDARVAALSRMQ